MPKINLQITEALPKDVDRGIIRLHKNVMEQIGVNGGDIVSITGTKTIMAVVWSTANIDMNFIRMDGSLRKNAGVHLDQTVFNSTSQ